MYTIVTTPRLGLELDIFNGLSDSGRSLAPQKSLEMLPPVYGESKPFERDEEEEHLTLDLRLRVDDGIIADVRARSVVRLVAVAVAAATSIFPWLQRETPKPITDDTCRIGLPNCITGLYKFKQ